MDELTNYNIKGFNFAVWFFRLVLLIFITIIILLFVLNINETVSIREGELVAANPQSDYKAPFEAQFVKNFVSEGQHVNPGDTLLIIHNEEYTIIDTTKKAEIAYLEKRIASIGVLQVSLQKKKAAIKQAGLINSKRHKSDIKGLANEVNTLNEQYSLQKERLRSAIERYKADSILYSKDMLSKMEFENSKDAHLILKENLSNVKNQKQKQLTEKDVVSANFNKEQNSLIVNQVELMENDQALLQAKSELETQLIQAKEKLKEIQKLLSRQYIIATEAGIVNFIFNTRQVSNIINKGDLLVSVAPVNISYYAKAIIPQKDARYVKAGLRARLKLDAYYQFELGIIKGKVTYMAERKEKEKFYALIQLEQAKNYQLRSGYTFQGEIIVQRLPLLKYIIKKLFRRFDP